LPKVSVVRVEGFVDSQINCVSNGKNLYDSQTTSMQCSSTVPESSKVRAESAVVLPSTFVGHGSFGNDTTVHFCFNSDCDGSTNDKGAFKNTVGPKGGGTAESK
jgi:hypothetical protein